MEHQRNASFKPMISPNRTNFHHQLNFLEHHFFHNRIFSQGLLIFQQPNFFQDQQFFQILCIFHNQKHLADLFPLPKQIILLNLLPSVSLHSFLNQHPFRVRKPLQSLQLLPHQNHSPIQMILQHL